MLVLALVVITDQLTKRWVIDSIPRGDTRRFLPAIDLVHVENHGVAFGVLAGGHTVVSVLVALALLGLLAYFIRHGDRPLLWLPTGLLVGGAVGNVLDRLRDGAVTDFIKLPLWPAFNLADLAITVGVFTLLYVAEERARAR
ncbi:MAG TPA: signal peptidase II [Solirubrobacteraceae bacterium]|jgi:signal peptidase II|nr:signal peptidase II [Solirubrobacteraceae bacterium]